jgi:serine/threonine protein kinase
VGTRRYQAPELIEGKRYSYEEADIFSMGVILFMMVVGQMPFQTVACQEDPIYSALCQKDPATFWNHFKEEHQEPEAPRSPLNSFLIELKELLFCLLIGPLFNFLKQMWNFISLMICRLFKLKHAKLETNTRQVAGT